MNIRVYWNFLDYSSDEEIKRDIQLGICHEETFFDDVFVPAGLDNHNTNLIVCGFLFRMDLSPIDTNYYWEVLEG